MLREKHKCRYEETQTGRKADERGKIKSRYIKCFDVYPQLLHETDKGQDPELTETTPDLIIHVAGKDVEADSNDDLHQRSVFGEEGSRAQNRSRLTT